ncbi:MAG: preprotein translocase subunit YajC [Clostridiales bacterium]|nr:MAG: preprotein translocase subunit YajC [Clostridiales bacterium]
MGQFLSTYGGMLLILIVMIGFTFFMSRKDKKRQQERKNMQNNLEVGDTILMECGIIGKVVSTKDLDTIIIETGADKTKLRFKRWAIASKVDE